MALVSCRNEKCDNARACVVNNTHDTVYYGWGSSWYSDTLLPGARSCQNLGEMDKYTTYHASFNSSSGDVNIEVDECHEIRYLD